MSKVKYTPEEQTFYDELAKAYGGERNMWLGFLSHSNATPDNFAERLHQWIREGVIQRDGPEDLRHALNDLKPYGWREHMETMETK